MANDRYGAIRAARVTESLMKCIKFVMHLHRLQNNLSQLIASFPHRSGLMVALSANQSLETAKNQ